MSKIDIQELNVGESYYIFSRSYPNDIMIGIFEKIENIPNDSDYFIPDMYVVYFSNIFNLSSKEIYGKSFGAGSRHNFWFDFGIINKIKYNKKIEKLYNDATNIKLQSIIGDVYFKWN